MRVILRVRGLEGRGKWKLGEREGEGYGWMDGWMDGW
jgi:hypothetical protein